MRISKDMDPVIVEARLRASELTRRVRSVLPTSYAERGVVTTEWYGRWAHTTVKTTRAEAITVHAHTVGAFPLATVWVRAIHRFCVVIDWEVRDGNVVGC